MKSKSLALMLILANYSNIALANSTDINEKIDQLCATNNMVIEQVSYVDEVYATALHRNGKLQIVEQVTDPNYLNSLQKTSISLGDDCFEFLKEEKVIEVVNTGPIARVYFNFDQATLTSASKQILAEVAQRIKDKNGTVILEGHTDSIGSEKYNLELGLDRATKTADNLNQNGIAVDKLAIQTQGEATPVESNETEVGREKNRRVEITIE
ncbi:OmpA family protein [Vibrio sp. SS-MA-C1-2]|uniref:OmpA family protein n=1 Tax=Vibrio sp. SS-MA-C1-2 TaxID=2908646 RepID=UPI001F47ADA6|nr:OmpA family protein [Vibrio sp. SS-MA-C1-2]UJF17509.1 OmpA family protein [Vibrio sp. SS-MA-C1-2]